MNEARSHQVHELTAALCLMNEGEKAWDLFAFSAVADEQALLKIAATLVKEGREPEELLAKVKKLKSTDGGSSLEDVHPGWILEKLERESPQVMGILCRTLPGDRVKYLIEHLSESQKKNLPKINASYQVSDEIHQIVRRVIEGHFPKHQVLSRAGGGASFSFHHIVIMKPDDLMTLFHDLGLEEIRQGFTNVEPRVLKAFLARFTPKKAKEIRDRIEMGSAVSREAKQEAQRHLVSLSLDKLAAGDLFRDIGYTVFARAVSKDDLPWAESVYQKLPPEQGYRLKRAFQEVGTHRNAQTLDSKKSEVLSRLFILAEKGLIRKYWKSK